MAELPPPPDGIALTHFIVSDDVERSRQTTDPEGDWSSAHWPSSAPAESG
jgi:hypothetical protein